MRRIKHLTIGLDHVIRWRTTGAVASAPVNDWLLSVNRVDESDIKTLNKISRANLKKRNRLPFP
jgi:hypothetical protein